MDKPDFVALRAERNAQFDAFMVKMRTEGWVMPRPYNYDACYCACSNGGPCEHKWDGEGYESEDDGISSATCSRCGMLAFNHDLRNGP